jgi:hypothetical protein
MTSLVMSLVVLLLLARGRGDYGVLGRFAFFFAKQKPTINLRRHETCKEKAILPFFFLLLLLRRVDVIPGLFANSGTTKLEERRKRVRLGKRASLPQRFGLDGGQINGNAEMGCLGVQRGCRG